MSKFWGRTYHLKVTTAGGEVLEYEPPLHINFFVNNFPQHTNATAKIAIYGLSSRARELIQVRDDEENHYGRVELSAGYEENNGIVFTGRINSVQVSKDGVSTVITLYCNSASAQWNAAIFKSWGENTPYLEIIRDIASGFGAPVEILGDFSDLPVLPFGRSGGGRLCRDLLDELKDTFGFNWLHTPTKIVISRDGAAREYVEHEINYRNGMEGVPRWYANALEVDIKMNHQIQPGDIANVTSSFWTLNFSGMYFTDLQDLANTQRTTGKFNVIQTVHEGGLWGDTWKTTVICHWRETQ
ncbi:baseplate hub protein [Klebsiella oxytoca]|nr:hypothetical protein [Klebsiella oxytoca]